jgi:hypothetical protein
VANSTLDPASYHMSVTEILPSTITEGESLSHFAHLSHTYHLPCRRFPVHLTDIVDDGGAPWTPKR